MALEEKHTIIDTVATCDRCGTTKKLEDETEKGAGDALRRESWTQVYRSAFAETENHFPNKLWLCPPCDAEFKEWAAAKKGKA